MKFVFTALALAASLALLPVVAQGQVTLIFATSNAEQHPLNKAFFTPWAERINEAANGAVEVDVRHGPMLANHTNFYDRVIDDVTQIGWGMTIFNPGRFPRTLVSTLPFLVENSEQGAAALCLMYEDGLFDEEFADIVPLIFVQFPQASLHMRDGPAETLTSIEGKGIHSRIP